MLELGLLLLTTMSLLWDYAPSMPGHSLAYAVKFGGWIALTLLGVKWLFKKTGNTTGIFHALVLLLLAWALISAGYSVNPVLTIQRTASLTFMMVGIFWTLWHYIQDWRRGESILWMVVAFSLVFVLLSGLQLATGGDQAYESDRFRGFLDNANTVGSVVGLTLGPLWYGAKYSRKRLWRTACQVAAALGFVIAILCQSRGGVLAVFVSGAVMLAADKGSFWRRVGPVLVAVAVVWGSLLVVGGTGLSALIGRFSGEALLEDRTLVWSVAYDLIRQSPILGYGFGVMTNLMAASVDLGAHSSPFAIGVELGFVGMIIVFSILTLAIVKTTRLFRSNLSAQQRYLVGACLGTLLAGCVNGLFESWWISAGSLEAALFWIVCMIPMRMVYVVAAENNVSTVKGLTSYPKR